MKRRDFIKNTATGLALSSLPIWLNNCSIQSNKKPNIVLFLVDDMGYEVPGFNGGTSYNTPNIDKLAATGMKFTYCYSAPVCSPSRTQLLTGRYTFRTGEEWGVLPENETTISSLLQNAGYRTAIVGKWQFGKIGDDPSFINRKGFDEYCCWGWHEGPRYWNPWIWENGKVKENISDRYGPDVLQDFSIEFMHRSKDQPFFLYYPMLLTHFAKTGGKYKEPVGPNGEYQSYADMVANLDRIIGEFTEALNNSGLAEDTIIIFTTDNGTPEGIISNMGDRKIPGGKKSMKDTGTHVPLVVNWKGKLKPGSVNENLIDFTDFFPTFLGLAEQEKPKNLKIDGKSFKRQLSNEDSVSRKWAYQEWHGEAWIRNKEWKLYRDTKLFNVSEDPNEDKPYYPETDTQISQKMRRELTEYLAELDSTK
ncbi:MAG: sulfatase-like hydrolase/transferase [Melioribacteraceae bacterium]|nr:sulfatase-like hydrolase/transferase [Melioribacteraceae bacterium]